MVFREHQWTLISKRHGVGTCSNCGVTFSEGMHYWSRLIGKQRRGRRIIYLCAKCHDYLFLE